jgi:O-antigen/teichoic acid export membrane protein
MTAPDSQPSIWGLETDDLSVMARNISTRYLAIAVDGVIGLLMLPFNVSHLGQSAYGLWALVASITIYFSVLDLGYGGALVKFVAQYRAWRDRESLNEIVSTMFVVFSAVGLATLVASGIVAWQFGLIFKVSPEQIDTGRKILLILGCYITIRFALSVFGAVVYGFQRYYLNNGVSLATSVAAAVVNVFMLQSGYGLVGLVAATTAVRVLALGGFVCVAYRVYPGLQVRPTLFRRARLREVTGFSVYMLVLDWSAKLNYSADALVIGALVGTAAVAVWTVAQRIAEVSQQLTSQLGDALFPMIVDSDASQRLERLRIILRHGTRFSLALATPVCIGLAIEADLIVHAWVGDRFSGSITVVRLLLSVVLIRVANSSAQLILKGAGRHRLLAVANATTAIANVLLSIALVGPLGLAGVALGTLIPIGSTAAFVLFPAACRRVGLPVAHVIREAIWPALWPVAGLCAALWLGRIFQPTSLGALALQLAVAGLVYGALFAMSLSSAERRFYWSTAAGLFLGRPRLPVAA